MEQMTKLQRRAQWSGIMAALRVHPRVPDAVQRHKRVHARLRRALAMQR
jgi:hypothetical protein